MRVSEVMTLAVVAEAADDTVADAARKMREQQTGSLLVMDGARLAGIFTERDVLKAVALGHDPATTPLKDRMTTDVVTIAPDAKLREAAAMMASKWIRHLPVVEGEKVVGVISQRDLVGIWGQTLEEVPEPQVPETQLARAQRLRRIGAGDLD
jgi:CBS domain-containing protein